MGRKSAAPSLSSIQIRLHFDKHSRTDRFMMPARKRARTSQATSPNVQIRSNSPEIASNATNDEVVLNDPWTDEEETGLFKGLIKWKPTGIHKHFRMIQLHDYLLDNRYIHPTAAHTKIPGVWQKLESLYDLEALDQREDSRQLSDLSGDEDEDDDDEGDGVEDMYNIAENKIHNASFELPDTEYSSKMWESRLASDKAQRDESPPVMPELNLAMEHPVQFTPSFSIEPEEIAAPVARRRGRPSNNAVKAKQTASRSTKRSSRQVNVDDEGEKEVQDSDDDEEEQEDGDEDDDDEEESRNEDEDSTLGASTRSGRSQGRGHNRSRPRTRRRG